MQLRSLDQLTIAARPGRPVVVAEHDPQAAAAVLEAMGLRAEAALLLAHEALDSAAAKRLGKQYGLITDNGARHP